VTAELFGAFSQLWYIEKKFFGVVWKEFRLKLFFKLTAAPPFCRAD